MARTPTAEPRMTAESSRLDEAREKGVPWRQWGPYLSERQWGTVRIRGVPVLMKQKASD